MARWAGEPEIGFDCGKCSKHEWLVNLRGCFKEGDMTWTMGGEESRLCPKSRLLMSDDPESYFNAYDYYLKRDKGLLPNPGSYMDQPAVINEMADIIEHEFNRLQNEEFREKEKEIDRQQRLQAVMNG